MKDKTKNGHLMLVYWSVSPTFFLLDGKAKKNLETQENPTLQSPYQQQQKKIKPLRHIPYITIEANYVLRTEF